MAECLIVQQYDGGSISTMRVPADKTGATDIATLLRSRTGVFEEHLEMNTIEGSTQYAKVHMSDEDGNDFFFTALVGGSETSKTIQDNFVGFKVDGITMTQCNVGLFGHKS